MLFSLLSFSQTTGDAQCFHKLNLLNIISSFPCITGAVKARWSGLLVDWFLLFSYPARIWNIKYLSYRKLLATQALSQNQKNRFAIKLEHSKLLLLNYQAVSQFKYILNVSSEHTSLWGCMASIRGLVVSLQLLSTIIQAPIFF